jgi:hypothetical protein
MNPDTESNKLPDHYGSLRQLIGKIVRGYLRSVDATIRLLGTCIICAILHGAFWAALNGISELFFGDSLGDGFVLMLTFIISPVIIRFGLLGGGFVIPPIFGSRENQAVNKKQNNPHMATPSNPND